MAAAAQHGIGISLTCSVFDISETGYRYRAKRQARNNEMANWLSRLTDNN